MFSIVACTVFKAKILSLATDERSQTRAGCKMDQQNGSLIHSLSFNSKEKLILLASFDSLQSFVEEALCSSGGIWSSPGANAISFIKIKTFLLHGIQDQKLCLLVRVKMDRLRPN